MIKVEHEHPTQLAASAFLRAIADDDAAGIFTRLSPETRGILEGLYAARSGVAPHAAADRLHDVVAPLRASALAVLGDPVRVGRFGVSGARVVDRHTAYVLLVPEVEREGFITEAQWRPAHLIGFVYGSREWLVDLGRTAALSAEAQLPDPFGEIR